MVGPAGSGMLVELVRDSLLASKTHRSQDPAVLKNGGTLQVFAPGATVPSCDLYALAVPKGSNRHRCFLTCQRGYRDAVELLHDEFPQLLDSLNIVRTIGTDDVLATALLWELWQRGVNRKHSCQTPKEASS